MIRSLRTQAAVAARTSETNAFEPSVMEPLQVCCLTVPHLPTFCLAHYLAMATLMGALTTLFGQWNISIYPHYVSLLPSSGNGRQGAVV